MAAQADNAVSKVAQITTIYADENGESRFGEFKIKMSGSGKGDPVFHWLTSLAVCFEAFL